MEIFLIRHGRLLAQRRVEQDDDQIRDELRTLVSEAAALGTPPARVGRAEVDQINIIARWISHHSEDDARAFFRLPRELDDTDAVESFIAQVTDTVLTNLITDSANGPGDVADNDSDLSAEDLTDV
jgi:DNA polymerase-3 subunit epsilon